MYTQNYYSLISWPPPRLLLLTLEMQTYVGLSPVTENASWFNASWISYSAVYRGCCSSRKLWQLSRFLTSHILKIVRSGGRGICTRQIEYLSKLRLPTLPQSSVQKVGAYFRELTINFLSYQELWPRKGHLTQSTKQIYTRTCRTLTLTCTIL